MLFKKLLNYINPFAHLGKKKYPLLFPLVISVIAYVLGDVVGNLLWGQSMQRANTMIFITFALVIYFSFRSGIKGGLIVTGLSMIYFSYYIYIGKASLEEKITAAVTVCILSIFYLLIALIVGRLRQKIDRLIEQETKARIAAEEAKLLAESGQKRLQAILEQLPVGVFVVTAPNGKIINSNKEITKILGKKPSSKLKEKDYGTFKSYSSGKNIKTEELPLAKTLLQGKTIVGDEIIFIDKAKNRKVLLINAAPIKDKTGKIIAGVSTMQDITNQKDLERQKDDFLGIASHELKTPVTSIKAYGQVLEAMFRLKGDTKAAGQIAKMDAQVDRLTNLIGDLLDVTKIRSGKLQFHEDYFDFKELVLEIIEEIQRTSEKHQIINELTRTTSIYGDKERIGQVLTNLITNAIKYSPHSDKIIVATSFNKENITLSVKDFGVGIPKDMQRKVFEQFFRVSGPKKDTFPGLGLGLYISSKIIKREGGQIWVESKEGKGSTFFFSLPTSRKKMNIS